MKIEKKLKELGIELSEPAKPLATHVPAVRAGDFVYVSGQLPTIAGQLQAKGIVGSDLTPEKAKEAARTCAINCLAALKSVVGDLDKVKRIVKVVGYVASAPGFIAQPGVVNGASELLGQVFGEAGLHARAAVGVTELPLGAPCEIELIAHVV
ncbi:MAG: RidA family protein [Bacillota bacterium]|nr:RidA family protein [Bacillota bacterium]